LIVPTHHTLQLKIVDEVGQLILNQPPSNKMSLDFFKELDDVVDFITRTPEIRALVINGKGRHYSSGAELSSLLNEIRIKSTTDHQENLMEAPLFLATNYRTFLGLEKMEIPVVSAIRGVCLGSALELALFSHFRFCGEDAVFGLPESSFNLMPGLGGISKLASLAGKAKTIELVLKGKTFTAEDAIRLNIVDRILPRREVVQRSLVFAKTLIADYRVGKKTLYLKNYFSS